MNWALKNKGVADVKNSHWSRMEIEVWGGDPLELRSRAWLWLSGWHGSLIQYRRDVSSRVAWAAVHGPCPLEVLQNHWGSGFWGKLLSTSHQAALRQPPSCSLPATMHQGSGALGRPLHCKPFVGGNSMLRAFKGGPRAHSFPLQFLSRPTAVRA